MIEKKKETEKTKSKASWWNVLAYDLGVFQVLFFLKVCHLNNHEFF